MLSGMEAVAVTVALLSVRLFQLLSRLRSSRRLDANRQLNATWEQAARKAVASSRKQVKDQTKDIPGLDLESLAPGSKTSVAGRLRAPVRASG